MTTPDAASTAFAATATPVSRGQTPDPRAPWVDFTAMQLEIDRAHEVAGQAARETLKRIFPNVDDEVADMVLEANHGDVGLAIDQLLEMVS